MDGNDLGVWLPGDYAELPLNFSRVEVTPIGPIAGEFRIGAGRFSSSRMVIANQAATNPTTTAKTATVGSTALIAANQARNYLLIQNNDPTGYIVVTFGGAAATLTNGLRIAAGGYWEWTDPASVPKNAANVIGNIANANLIVMEG
ncbi:hypothetical protein [Roseateles violae]|uniref:Uncharacterized protein n=1 Tax=Roseateles violae TaxID=3058042 RepID=A0ABT8E0E6_9BURK|nr:hypothetical protein [Pelomonas sp. PFR6]MDN3923332.1 hypothetical protein [Pelomonas sp. PFR6]